MKLIHLFLITIGLVFTLSKPFFFPVTPYLPHTEWRHLRPCGTFFNEMENFDNSLQCINERVFMPELHNTLQAIPPRCFIVTKESPDIRVGEGFNYMSFDLLSEMKILGFYTQWDNTTYITETYDAAAIYRHEVGHQFLGQMTGNADARHLSNVWKTCETQYYTPSKESIENNNK